MKTNFPINTQEIKIKVNEYVDNGMTHLDNQLILSEELTEFCLFYCFKAALYEQSYKHESSSKNLMDFQANELAYKDIYDEISNDSISYFKK